MLIKKVHSKIFIKTRTLLKRNAYPCLKWQHLIGFAFWFCSYKAAAHRKPAMYVCKPSKGNQGYSGRQEWVPKKQVVLFK